METENGEKICDITRRHAMRIAIHGGLVLVGTLFLGQESEAAIQWERAGAIAEFAIGVPKLVTLAKGKTVFILRQDKTHWLALSPKCTHAGADIHWDTKQKLFVCPLHAATFTKDGQNPTGPARKPLSHYPTQVKGKDVQVDVANVPASGGGKGGKKRQEEENEHEGDEKKGDEKKGHEKDTDK